MISYIKGKGNLECIYLILIKYYRVPIESNTQGLCNVYHVIVVKGVLGLLKRSHTACASHFWSGIRYEDRHKSFLSLYFLENDELE